MASPDEDTVDEILYLARANQVNELESFLSSLVSGTNQSKSEVLVAAVDPYSKNSALHYASANGHDDIIKLLVSSDPGKPASALINAVNDAGNTALHWAALNGHLESVKLLMKAGADVTIFNKAGHDAVFEAEINDKQEVVDWLLGAVEELENGIGNEGEASRGNNNNANMTDDEFDPAVTKNTAQHDGSLGTTSVEAVRKQVEGMSAKDEGQI